MNSLREKIRAAQFMLPVLEASNESYSKAILFLARYFLDELDTRPPEWRPETDSAMALGDALYPLVRDRLPEAFRTELSGGQVYAAAHLAYRARAGD